MYIKWKWTPSERWVLYNHIHFVVRRITLWSVYVRSVVRKQGTHDWQKSVMSYFHANIFWMWIVIVDSMEQGVLKTMCSWQTLVARFLKCSILTFKINNQFSRIILRWITLWHFDHFHNQFARWLPEIVASVVSELFQSSWSTRTMFLVVREHFVRTLR